MKNESEKPHWSWREDHVRCAMFPHRCQLCGGWVEARSLYIRRTWNVGRDGVCSHKIHFKCDWITRTWTDEQWNNFSDFTLKPYDPKWAEALADYQPPDIYHRWIEADKLRRVGKYKGSRRKPRPSPKYSKRKPNYTPPDKDDWWWDEPLE